jgi:hypothetical protein
MRISLHGTARSVCGHYTSKKKGLVWAKLSRAGSQFLSLEKPFVIRILVGGTFPLPHTEPPVSFPGKSKMNSRGPTSSASISGTFSNTQMYALLFGSMGCGQDKILERAEMFFL